MFLKWQPLKTVLHTFKAWTPALGSIKYNGMNKIVEKKKVFYKKK